MMEDVILEWSVCTVYSPGGEKLRSFGTHGSGQGQFQLPCGVAVDVEGNILVRGVARGTSVSVHHIGSVYGRRGNGFLMSQKYSLCTV